jgi:hypothetical protein
VTDAAVATTAPSAPEGSTAEGEHKAWVTRTICLNTQGQQQNKGKSFALVCLTVPDIARARCMYHRQPLCPCTFSG